MKNKLDSLLFHTSICAGASQIDLMADEKSKTFSSPRRKNAPEWRLV